MGGAAVDEVMAKLGFGGKSAKSAGRGAKGGNGKGEREDAGGGDVDHTIEDVFAAVLGKDEGKKGKKGKKR